VLQQRAHIKIISNKRSERRGKKELGFLERAESARLQKKCCQWARGWRLQWAIIIDNIVRLILCETHIEAPQIPKMHFVFGP
jgi:hypothetical protein